MKKIFLILTIFFILNQTSIGQVFVDGVNINEADVEYIELLVVSKTMSDFTIYIDYGVKYKMFKYQKISDKNGKLLDFETPVEALNFMLKNGWEYIEYTRLQTGSSYILRKKSNNN